MVVTLLCCYPSFLLGPQYDLVKLLRLDNQRDAPLGGGECVRAFVLCMFYLVQCVCVLSMFGMQSKGITLQNMLKCVCAHVCA